MEISDRLTRNQYLNFSIGRRVATNEVLKQRSKTMPVLLLILLKNYSGGEHMQRTCSLCNEKLPTAESCTCSKIRYPSDIVSRIQFGDEEYDWGTRHCPRCGVLRNGYHHENCACEICPMCGELLTQCDCDAQFVI